MKTKPMFLFMNMLFQKTIERIPNQPSPTAVGFVPRLDPPFDDHDHDHDHDHEHAHQHSH
jgi:hypothetical protein